PLLYPLSLPRRSSDLLNERRIRTVYEVALIRANRQHFVGKRVAIVGRLTLEREVIPCKYSSVSAGCKKATTRLIQDERVDSVPRDRKSTRLNSSHVKI